MGRNRVIAVVGTVTSAVGAVVSSTMKGPEWLAGSLWTLFGVGILTLLALHLNAKGGAESPTVEAEQEGSDNAQALGGRDAAAQSGTGNMSQQGHHNSMQVVYAGPGTHTEDDGRIYCNLTPQELTKFFADHPTDDAEKLAAKWIGTFLRVEGPLYDRLPYPGGSMMTSFALDTYGRTELHMIFTDETEIKRVKIIQRDEWMRVIGRITSIGHWSVVLEDCELEHPQAASKPGSPSS